MLSGNLVGIQKVFPFRTCICQQVVWSVFGDNINRLILCSSVPDPRYLLRVAHEYSHVFHEAHGFHGYHGIHPSNQSTLSFNSLGSVCPHIQPYRNPSHLF